MLINAIYFIEVIIIVSEKAYNFLLINVSHQTLKGDNNEKQIRTKL
jgi:hypothetical protein